MPPAIPAPSMIAFPPESLRVCASATRGPPTGAAADASATHAPSARPHRRRPVRTLTSPLSRRCRTLTLASGVESCSPAEQPCAYVLIRSGQSRREVSYRTRTPAAAWKLYVSVSRPDTTYGDPEKRPKAPSCSREIRRRPAGTRIDSLLVMKGSLVRVRASALDQELANGWPRTRAGALRISSADAFARIMATTGWVRPSLRG
jgi:hypothetical protein